MVTRKNPLMQKSITKSLNTSVATINHKNNVHHLLMRHVTQCKTFIRALYENHLAGNKWNYIVKLDEVWVK